MSPYEYTYSIVIPTYNRYQKLIRLLHSIHNELGKDNPVVIVVDDGSSDETHELKSAQDKNITVIHIPHSGPAVARNSGAKYVDSDYILFVDDDCIIPTNYSEGLHAILCQRDWDIFGGATQPWAESGHEKSVVSRFLRDIGHLAGPYYAVDGQIRCLPSSHLLISKITFHALDGFDPRFPLAGGEDNNFTQRAIANGFRAKSSPNLWIYHEHIGTVKAFYQKFYEYGVGNALNCILLNYSTRKSEFRGSSLPKILIEFPGSVWMSVEEAFKLTQHWPDRLSYIFLLILRQLSYDIGGIHGFKQHLRNQKRRLD